MVRFFEINSKGQGITLTDEPQLDPRRHAYREDLAAKSLEGRVQAPRFVEGQRYQVCAMRTPVRRRPQPQAALDTEALMGEQLTVYDEVEGWAWGQLDRDGYVGYLPAADLICDVLEATHWVRAVLALVYSAPSALAAPVQHLSFNSLVTVIGESGDFAKLASGGFIGKRHISALNLVDPDYVGMAQRFIGLPYLYGGKSALGLDCSALVQNVLQAANYSAPRDSDMQAAEIGSKIDVGPDLQGLIRGDLVFWPGHVGIMTSPTMIVHASATMMEVTLEPVHDVAKRSRKGGPIVASVTRLPIS